jgi:hypothetical protein
MSKPYHINPIAEVIVENTNTNRGVVQKFYNFLDDIKAFISYKSATRIVAFVSEKDKGVVEKWLEENLKEE